MLRRYIGRWALLCVAALVQGAPSDDVLFFFTDVYGYCGYDTALMEIAGSGLCAYDSTIRRVYMCDQDYAAAIGDACYALGQTCEEGSDAPGDDQILCEALGVDKTHKWCCSTAELCITGQSQYNVCGTKFLRPNTTKEQEYEALGVKAIPATFTAGQPIGTLNSQKVVSRTTVQTGTASSSTPSATSGASPGGSASSDGDPSLGAGAIAGIVVGGVVLLALIAGGIWLLLKRRARRQNHAAATDGARQAFEPGTVDAKYGRGEPVEAPNSFRHELAINDPSELSGTQMRHEKPAGIREMQTRHEMG